jgi:hypothetical protein
MPLQEKGGSSIIASPLQTEPSAGGSTVLSIGIPQLSSDSRRSPPSEPTPNSAGEISPEHPTSSSTALGALSILRRSSDDAGRVRTESSNSASAAPSPVSSGSQARSPRREKAAVRQIAADAERANVTTVIEEPRTAILPSADLGVSPTSSFMPLEPPPVYSERPPARPR